MKEKKKVILIEDCEHSDYYFKAMKKALEKEFTVVAWGKASEIEMSEFKNVSVVVLDLWTMNLPLNRDEFVAEIKNQTQDVQFVFTGYEGTEKVDKKNKPKNFFFKEPRIEEKVEKLVELVESLIK